MSSSDILRVRRYFERGVYFINQNQLGDACVNLKDALYLAPYFLPARTHLAIALTKQRKYLEAIHLLEEARKSKTLREDELVEVLELLGNISLIRQDHPAAIYYLRAAYKIDSNNAHLRAKLATALCKGGKLEEGIDLLIENARKLGTSNA
ncbi:MAG: hypothetical protein WC966_07445 [Bradymonadales bacterium]|jgi:predicted Zn-dependent protease